MYDDQQSWNDCKPCDLWLFDKLLVARKLGYRCGPAGVDVDRSDRYVVRPCVNLMGMGRGAYVTQIEKSTDHLPEGTFWCELFQGRHLSVDYVHGQQVLCVEGFRDNNDPLWKWKQWRRVDDQVPLPDVCQSLSCKYINVEIIGDKLIEVHARLNSDWKDLSPGVKALEPCYQAVDGMLENRDYKRVGFITLWE